MSSDFPQNVVRLHSAEEHLRQKAQDLLIGDAQLNLYLAVTEAAMELANVMCQFPTNDEALKVVQMLGMRTFNAFGAALKLALSGYHQNCALVLRFLRLPSCWICLEATMLSLSDGDLPTRKL
jgi:hypothetical protein